MAEYIKYFINTSFTTYNIPADLMRVNTGWLISKDTSTSGSDYNIFSSLSAVEDEYDSSTDTYKTASRFFSNGGQGASNSGALLMISRLSSATGPTQGKFETTDISANLAAILAITDGSLTVNAVEYSGLNFSKKKSWAGIAEVFNTKLTAIRVMEKTNGLLFINDDLGSDSVVTITAGTVGTNLAVSGLLNIAGGTATAGTNGAISVSEITQLLTAQQNAYLPCIVMLGFGLPEADVVTVAQAVKNLSSVVHFIHGFEAGSSAYTVLKAEMDVNDKFHLFAFNSTSSEVSDIESVYFTMHIMASQLSTNIFNAKLTQSHFQLSGKDIDPARQLNVMGFAAYNNSVQKALFETLKSDGVGVYVPVNDGRYLMYVSDRTISNTTLSFSNSIFIAQLTHAIDYRYTTFLQKNNLLRTQESLAKVSIDLIGSIFGVISEKGRMGIIPFTGDATLIPDIVSGNPSITTTQKQEMVKCGYFLYPAPVETGYTPTLYIQINTAFGISTLDVLGTNIVS